MSEQPEFNLRAELARIDRERAESAKFAAEQRKLSIEALKLDRERWWFPWTQLLVAIVLNAAIAAAVAVVVARLVH